MPRCAINKVRAKKHDRRRQFSGKARDGWVAANRKRSTCGMWRGVGKSVADARSQELPNFPGSVCLQCDSFEDRLGTRHVGVKLVDVTHG